MTMRKPKGWKAVLAMFIGAGAVVWHIMACVESPMSFAPNGDLAFTVMDPYHEEDIGKAGGFLFRMMILSEDRELRVVEASQTHLLSGPGYSADGARIAYLRAPLLTKADEERFESFLKSRYEGYKQARNAPPGEKWIAIAPEGVPPEPPSDPVKGMTDLTLPPTEPAGEIFGRLQLGGGISEVELVVRDAATGAVVRTVAVELPSTESEGQQALTYLLARPQFAADGRSVHFWSNYFSVEVGLEDGKTRLLAAPNFGGLMAPDGRTLAVLSAEGKSFGLVRTDGSRATYVRLEHEPSLSGMAWAGADRLVVLGKGQQTDTAALDVYNAVGDRIGAADLPIAGANSDNSGELALSPDGRRVVVSYGDVVYWLTFDGKVIASWKAGESGEVLVQPIFTPDSRQVAFKHMAKDETEGRRTSTGTDAIAFFTADGRELFRVPVPRFEPADAPDTQPPQQ